MTTTRIPLSLLIDAKTSVKTQTIFIILNSYV